MRFRMVGVVALISSVMVGVVQAQQPPPTAKPPTATGVYRLEVPPDRGWDANFYMQTSAEYRACCLQTYRWAGERLRKALDEAKAKDPAVRPAVVLDLDETVLDNACYQSTLLRGRWAFDQRLWSQWENLPDRVGLIPGAKEFIQQAEALGVAVAYISNRDEVHRDGAVRALDRLGIPPRAENLLLLSTGSSDKTIRRAAIEREHTVLMLVGDNLRDFDERFKTPALAARTVDAARAAIEARRAEVDATRAVWGDRWVILPNPAYGEWTRPLGLGRLDADLLAAPFTIPPDAAAPVSADDAARDLVARYVAARAAKDATALAALLTPDADQVVSDGTWRRGRDELVRGMIASTNANAAARTITVEAVRPVGSDVAMIDGRYTQAGDGDRPERAMWTSITIQRRDDGWKIAAIRNLLPSPPAPAPAKAAEVPAPAPVHKLAASPATVAWGHYNAATSPVLRINSGDAVAVETLITSSPSRLEGAGVAPDQVEPALRAIHNEVKDKGPGGHILTGPIFVEGAEPGDALEVRIRAIDLAIPYSYNAFGPRSGTIPEDFPRSKMAIIPFDRASRTARFADDITIPLRPFFGSMGVAPPPAAGRINSAPPGVHAGNLDNKELVAGTTLLIPVHVPGALFQVGDGHAAQGDGEVDITALETSLTGVLEFHVQKGKHLAWPRAETPTHLIAMGIDKDLDEAMRIATREAVALIVEVAGLSREDAYMLASVGVDFRVTQVVDGTKGVHAMIPRSLLPPRRRAG